MFVWPNLGDAAENRLLGFATAAFRRLTRRLEFVPMANVKLTLALLTIVAFALNACTTLANRRDLYSPDKPHGPYTQKLQQAEMESIKPYHPHPAHP